MFIYEAIVTIFVKDLSQYKQQFNTLKVHKISDNDLFVDQEFFPKNASG